MNEREKLINLLLDCDKASDVLSCFNERPRKIDAANIIADFLLENGIIVPPCTVGDTVYLVEDYGYRKEIKEYEVGCIVIRGTDDISKELWEDRFGGVIGSFNDFGKTIFLNKEAIKLQTRGTY